MFIFMFYTQIHVLYANLCSIRMFMLRFFLATPFFIDQSGIQSLTPLPLPLDASFSKPCNKIQTFGHLIYHLFEELWFLLFMWLSSEPLERSSEPFWFPSEPRFQSNPLVLPPTSGFILICFRHKLWYLNKIESWLSIYFV